MVVIGSNIETNDISWAVGQNPADQELALLNQRHSEERFRAAIEAIEGVLWTNNAAGKMTGEQAKWAELTGQSFEQYQNYGWADAIHPDDSGPTIEAWNIAVSQEVPFVFEHRVRRHDGEWRLHAVRAVPTRDAHGQIHEWVGVHRDITEERRAQALLARNAETFATLISSNPFGIYVIDADFQIVQVSRGAAKAFEAIQPLIGRDLADIMRIVWHEPFASEVIGRFRDTLATGESYVSQSAEQRADIDAVEAYDWRIERIVLPDGRFGVVCYFYDLSERISYEEQLKALIADKELLAREIDHRVKNSLTIVGSLLSMQHKASKSEETRAALAEAKSRVIAVARVHEQLHKSHAVGIVAFADYLRQLCKDLEYSLRRTGVELDFSADPVDLPAEQAMTLAIVVNELVTNAYKHGGAAGAKKITVRLAQRGNELLLSVADDGAGLPGGPITKSPGLGFRLIENLSKQLAAKLTMPKPGGPALFGLVLPYESMVPGTD